MSFRKYIWQHVTHKKNGVMFESHKNWKDKLEPIEQPKNVEATTTLFLWFSFNLQGNC